MHLTAPTAPQVEHLAGTRVLGLGTGDPRLSWTVPTAPSTFVQTGYELEVSRAGRVSTHRSAGAEQVLVPWPEEPLASREAASVRVRVACGDEWSPWSSATDLEVGLLTAQDWKASFISPRHIGGLHMPAPVVEGQLEVPGRVVSARLYATAHGLYVASLNGDRVGEDVLSPGWTSYEHRLRYYTHDVTALVREGDNRLALLLGNGWFRGQLGWGGQRAVYGDRLAALAQLEVTTDDGRVHVLSTGAGWTARESEVIADDLYDGQRSDLRRRSEDWVPAVDAVEVVSGSLDRLVAPEGPPMRVVQHLSAQRVWTSPRGRTLVDFGQNAVGWVRLTVRGLPAGHEVTVRHAEVLEDGELGTRPLREAKATDSYLLAGSHEQVLAPELTLHGFRYAQVEGVEGLRAEDIDMVVIGSDLRRSGWFTSSHELLDRLHENVVWSTRGNFVDLPTDCPQRDERLGWTGDVQVFAPTASYLFQTTGLLSSWLRDLAAEQQPDGTVPQIVPDVIRSSISRTPTAAWGDAATVIPWTLYQRTGDRGLLARQFPSMRAWVDREAELAGPDHLWVGGFQYGDWLDPTAPPDDPFRAKADPDVVATAHLARSAQLVADAARVLDQDDAAEKYAELARNVRAAFARAFVTPSGRVLSDAPTVYALALQWDLLPDESARRRAGDRLADLVRSSGFTISTGFVGTPLVCDALSDSGHTDVAFRLLLQENCPSWLYPVTMGATTIWERWDSMLPDGRINPGEMTSFNHYALGAVADWMHRCVAGLAPAEPGYRRLTVRPRPHQALEHASTRHLTPFGEAAVSWRRQGGRFLMSVTVPVGSSADVHLPGVAQPVQVEHGTHRFDVPDALRKAVQSSRSNSTVREVLDDQLLWERLTELATSRGLVSDARQAAGRLSPYLDAPPAVIASALAPEDRHPGAHQERALISELLLAGGAAPHR